MDWAVLGSLFCLLWARANLSRAQDWNSCASLEEYVIQYPELHCRIGNNFRPCSGLYCHDNSSYMLMGLYVENCKDPVGVDAYVYIYGDATDHTDNIYFGHQFNQTETVNGTSNSSSYRDVNSYTATVRRNASHVGFQLYMQRNGSSRIDWIFHPVYIPLDPHGCMCSSMQSILLSNNTCESIDECNHIRCNASNTAMESFEMNLTLHWLPDLAHDYDVLFPRHKIILDLTECGPHQPLDVSRPPPVTTCSAFKSIESALGRTLNKDCYYPNRRDCTYLVCFADVVYRETMIIRLLRCAHPPAITMSFGSNFRYFFEHTFNRSEVVQLNSSTTLNVTLDHFCPSDVGFQVDYIIDNNGSVTVIPYTVIPINTTDCGPDSGSGLACPSGTPTPSTPGYTTTIASGIAQSASTPGTLTLLSTPMPFTTVSQISCLASGVTCSTVTSPLPTAGHSTTHSDHATVSESGTSRSMQSATSQALGTLTPPTSVVLSTHPEADYTTTHSDHATVSESGTSRSMQSATSQALGTLTPPTSIVLPTLPKPDNTTTHSDHTITSERPAPQTSSRNSKPGPTISTQPTPTPVTSAHTSGLSTVELASAVIVPVALLLLLVAVVVITVGVYLRRRNRYYKFRHVTELDEEGL